MFTIAETYSLGFVGLIPSNIVIPAALITFVIVISLFTYAFFTTTDFTLLGGFLFMFGMVIFFASII